MIHELREYRFSKSKWPAYRELFNNLCLPLRGSSFGEFLGGWVSGHADDPSFLHLWQYPSLDERARLRRELTKIPEWTEIFLPRSRVLIRDQTLSVLNPVSGVILPPNETQYLHRYQCSTGGAAALVDHFQKSVSPGQLCLWIAEFPNPNEVLQLHRSSVPSVVSSVRTADGLRCVEHVQSQALEPLTDGLHRLQRM
ncbi:NIPSNAP family protein [Pseudomonas sp. NA-150]|uniref:NIPSNAP family protein n=1 Tax=Pseudomonas sp. NA-150 TaxID=3367525 RepID=UPI0037CA0DD3